MILRPFQTECLEAIRTAKQAGILRQLVSLPTGGGKTVIFSALPRFLGSEKRTLVLAHREELLDQAADKFNASNPGAFVEIEQADRSASPFASIVIASVPSIGKAGSARIQKFWPEQFDLIITDEAHHATAPTYQSIYKHFGLGERKDILHVGFTATPKRGDNTGLDSTFEEIVYHKDIQWMIDNGYLARITGRRVSTGTDLSRVRTNRGDFQSNDLARAVNNADRNAAIVKSYVVYAFGKKCLVFAVDVAHAIGLKDAFSGHGIRAEVITGETPREERAKILAAYALGEIKVLVNCMVLTEGFDEPSIEVIIMARPTTSSLLHTQMIGRGTRLFPGKEECLVIDMVDNSSKHSIRTIPSLFGLPANLDLKGGDARSAEKKYKAFVASHPHSRLALEPEQLTSLDLLDLQSEKIDFFKAPTFSPEVLANSQLTWIAHEGGFVMNAGHKKEARIEKDILGQYEITLTAADQKIFQAKEKDTGSAFRAADGAVRDLWPDSLGLLNRASGWRKDQATPGQLGLLRKLKVTFPSDIKKGDASVLISQALAKK